MEKIRLTAILICLCRPSKKLAGLRFEFNCAVHQKDLLEYEYNVLSVGKDSALASIGIFLYRRKRWSKTASLLKAKLNCSLS